MQVINEFVIKATSGYIWILEPKPSRDTQASSSSNYDRYGSTEDRLPSLLNTPFPAPGNNSNNNNSNSDPSSLNDCVLHVMCSPMVSFYSIIQVFFIDGIFVR